MHSVIYMWIHVCVYWGWGGVFSCWLLKLTVSTKGCVPTQLYDNQVRVSCTVKEVCQQQGCCFTATMATSRHQCVNSTAQLYDCWQRCCRLICWWERPVPVQCQDSNAYNCSVAETGVKWEFELNRGRLRWKHKMLSEMMNCLKTLSVTNWAPTLAVASVLLPAPAFTPTDDLPMDQERLLLTEEPWTTTCSKQQAWQRVTIYFFSSCDRVEQQCFYFESHSLLSIWALSPPSRCLFLPLGSTTHLIIMK